MNATLRGRGCDNRGAIGRNANRAADERCGSHELHVFAECEQRWYDELTVNFDVATDPNIDLVLTQMRESQASVTAAFQCPELRRDGGQIDFSAADGHFLILADGPVRFQVPGQLRLTSI